jgi:hypothetical protein
MPGNLLTSLFHGGEDKWLLSAQSHIRLANKNLPWLHEEFGQKQKKLAFDWMHDEEGRGAVEF